MPVGPDILRKPRGERPYDLLNRFLEAGRARRNQELFQKRKLLLVHRCFVCHQGTVAIRFRSIPFDAAAYFRRLSGHPVKWKPTRAATCSPAAVVWLLFRFRLHSCTVSTHVMPRAVDRVMSRRCGSYKFHVWPTW